MPCIRMTGCLFATLPSCRQMSEVWLRFFKARGMSSLPVQKFLSSFSPLETSVLVGPAKYSMRQRATIIGGRWFCQGGCKKGNWKDSWVSCHQPLRSHLHPGILKCVSITDVEEFCLCEQVGRSPKGKSFLFILWSFFPKSKISFGIKHPSDLNQNLRISLTAGVPNEMNGVEFSFFLQESDNDFWKKFL
jgi:hypothetical protein